MIIRRGDKIKLWIIILLIILAWMMYTYPDGIAQTIGDMTFGKLNEFLPFT